MASVDYIEFLKISKQLFVLLNYRGIITQLSFGVRAMLPPDMQIYDGISFASLIDDEGRATFKELFKLNMRSSTILYSTLKFHFSDEVYIIGITKESPNDILVCLYPETPSSVQVNIGAVPLRTVLVVDDDRVNQILMSEFLKKMGHRVLIASNGKEALEIVGETDIGMIFTDCEMPVLNGYDTTKVLRSLNFDLPIIGMTASQNDAEVSKKCLNSGMDDHMLKPITEERLKKAIAKWSLCKSKKTL